MKCRNCGMELSPKVWQIHSKTCEIQEDIVINMDNPYMDMTHDELKELAKERGIERYWLKSLETLELELIGSDIDD